MLNRRQISVQRENLATMCRISVKALLDYACLCSHVNDDSEEFINFSAVLEQLLSHRLRPHQRKAWLLGEGSPRHFWDVLLENHNRNRRPIFQTCIPNIEAIETIRSPNAKLRAFVRVALMEKRLSDYLFWLLDNKDLIRESYLDGALLASEEASLLCGDLIGLNAIDFNFCLKGNEKDLLAPLEISYSPFLKYQQISASQRSDEIEMLRLSGKGASESGHANNILSQGNITDAFQLQSLEEDVKHIKEQKDYLEELVRLKDRQMTEANTRMEKTKAEWQRAEKDWEKERMTMESCVLELQSEINRLRKQNGILKTQVAALKRNKQLKNVEMFDMDVYENRELDEPKSPFEMKQTDDGLNTVHRPVDKEPTIDHRSAESSVSSSIHSSKDSESMRPLTLSTDTEEHPAEDTSSERQLGSERADFQSFSTEGIGLPLGESLEDSTLRQNLSTHSKEDYSEDNTLNVDGGVDVSFENPESELTEGHFGSQMKNFETRGKVAESGVVPESIQFKIVKDSSEDLDAVDADMTAGCTRLAGGQHGVVAVVDGSSGSAGTDTEEQGVISEPMVVNSGSNSSDAAWEMVSGSENCEGNS